MILIMSDGLDRQVGPRRTRRLVPGGTKHSEQSQRQQVSMMVKHFLSCYMVTYLLALSQYNCDHIVV